MNLCENLINQGINAANLRDLEQCIDITRKISEYLGDMNLQDKIEHHEAIRLSQWVNYFSTKCLAAIDKSKC